VLLNSASSPKLRNTVGSCHGTDHSSIFHYENSDLVKPGSCWAPCPTPLPCSQVIHEYNVSVWGNPVQKLVAAVSAHFSYRTTNQIQIVHLTGYQAVFKQYLLPFEQESAIFNTCATPDSDSTEPFLPQLINDRTESL
jgi:hypothetical protein